jgi:hypothetical protein
MATVHEPLAKAIARIETAGSKVTGVKRFTF